MERVGLPRTANGALLLALAAAGAAAAVAAAVAAVTLPPQPVPAVTIADHVFIGCAWIVAGLVALWLRPSNGVGVLMTALGFLWFSTDLGWWSESTVYVGLEVTRDLALAVLAQLFVIYPSGRLSSTYERVLVYGAYSVALIGSGLLPLLFYAPGDDWPSGAQNFLLVSDRPALIATLDMATDVLAGAIVIGIVVLLVRRWLSATVPARRVLLPVVWTGVALATMNAAQWAYEDGGGELDGTVLAWATGLVYAAVPVGFLLGLLRMRLHRSAVADLVVELGATTDPGRVRDAIARALGDPGMLLLFWLPDAQRYVTSEGRAAALPEPGSARVATVLEEDGRPIAALVYDLSLTHDPLLVKGVAAAAQLALENLRLQIELRAQLEEVRASRARIVEAADGERRRLERDLHDGAQQRLLALRLAVRKARNRLADRDADLDGALAEIDQGLQTTLDELRALAQGVHPPILVQHGLPAALESLAEKAPVPVDLTVPVDVRLPPGLEAAAYFIASEAVTNACKHARANRVSLALARVNGQVTLDVVDDGVGGANADLGTGLCGIRDRVEAHAGRLRIESPGGRGTRVHVDLPCG